MVAPNRIVVVGAGIAAVTAADALRREGFTGSLAVVGDEAHAPYSRPPLSKGVLKKTETLESVTLPGLSDSTDLVTGARAVALDRAEGTVVLENGDRLPYDKVLIATGSRARTLRPDGRGESVLRGIDDAIALAQRLEAAKSVLVIGGGFLGMEIASTARHLGLEVTVIDLVPHLVRQFGAYLAGHMTRAAEEAGARLIVEPGGIELIGDDPVIGVRASSGQEIFADLVVSAVGDMPNVEWLASAGLADPAGLMIDSHCRLTEDVFAIGDVARWNGRRSPHWGAAIDQARIAATAMLHADAAPEYAPSPYFWTEQWGLDLKICGEIGPDAKEGLYDGSWEERSLIVQYHLGDDPVAAASVNRRYPIARLRKLARPVQLSTR